MRPYDTLNPPTGTSGQPDFFAQDCIARFLSLSTVASEGDRISSIAAVLEEEDRLSEALVSVLADRSTPAEKRNLRWDLLPVDSGAGLLHAKVSVLMWQCHSRIILGSANLTPAGYRRQIEVALAIDLVEGCRIPRAVLDVLISELRSLVAIAPGPADTGPKSRAGKTLDLLEQRAKATNLPERNIGALRLAMAPARPGHSPLDRLGEVWRGPQPLKATVLSPFWDDATPAPAVTAIRRLLTGRPAHRRTLTAVAAIDPYTGAVQAPASLAATPEVKLVVYSPPDDELRGVHAKVLLVESDEWVAAMIGSSNATEAGLGLHSARGHREINLWIGCAAGSPEAKALRALTGAGSPIPADGTWDAPPDEDEPRTPVLPRAFLSCLLEPAAPVRVHLTFDAEHLPEDWAVRDPAGQHLISSQAWRHNGGSPTITLVLPGVALPAYLIVEWREADSEIQATWTANVTDRAALPPPAELADLPVDVLLAALASTRPLPVALEHELRRREGGATANTVIDLDPLRRFDASGLLLHRARYLSLALWRLQERLARPTTSFDALHWRLRGAFGPLAIADSLVKATASDGALPGEGQFLIAELALTIAAVDWSTVGPTLDPIAVKTIVTDVLAGLAQHRAELPASPDPSLDGYVTEALAAAKP